MIFPSFFFLVQSPYDFQNYYDILEKWTYLLQNVVEGKITNPWIIERWKAVELSKLATSCLGKTSQVCLERIFRGWNHPDEQSEQKLPSVIKMCLFEDFSLGSLFVHFLGIKNFRIFYFQLYITGSTTKKLKNSQINNYSNNDDDDDDKNNNNNYYYQGLTYIFIIITIIIILLTI